ncbi:MAG: hypothetical protein VCB06_05950, partial [Alphaproteobacteria bacterium]
CQLVDETLTDTTQTIPYSSLSIPERPWQWFRIGCGRSPAEKSSIEDCVWVVSVKVLSTEAFKSGKRLRNIPDVGPPWPQYPLQYLLLL